jgi:HAD superfamily phosphoserine phosphatase-like hydrolase
MSISWNQEILHQIESMLNANRTHEGRKPLAVFDADGTLWPGDLGEAFFKHQIHFQLAPGLKGMKYPWDHYSSLDRASTADANAWIVKLNAGLLLKEVKAQAEAFYQKYFKFEINPRMKELIAKLKENNFDVWVCSASMKWAIEPALEDLGIPQNHIIGTECEVNQAGRLTQVIVTPIPYADGKKRALDKLFGYPPDFVCGNSTGDLAMLKAAQKMALVVQYQPGLPDLAGSELSLRQEAQNRGWPIQFFSASTAQ